MFSLRQLRNEQLLQQLEGSLSTQKEKKSLKEGGDPARELGFRGSFRKVELGNPGEFFDSAVYNETLESRNVWMQFKALYWCELCEIN